MKHYAPHAFVCLGASFLIALPLACTVDVRQYGTGGSSSDASSVSSGGTAGMGGTAGTGGNGGVAGNGGTGGNAGNGGAAGNCPATRACLTQVYMCGNGVDDDGDGRVDADDPECTGACDNSENGFDSSIPGSQPAPCFTDCQYDSNTGSGNDNCYWNYQCDPLEVAPNYFPQSNHGTACTHNPNANTPGTAASCAELMTTPTTACLDYCRPLVPNGCDCFGCCELPAHSGNFVLSESRDVNGVATCTLATVNDPMKCHPCTPVMGCFNACDMCERCLGDTAVPAGCPLNQQCAPGLQRCGQPDQPCCPDNSYCVTGCCIPLPM